MTTRCVIETARCRRQYVNTSIRPEPVVRAVVDTAAWHPMGPLVKVDISLDCAGHSGLAAAALCERLVSRLPELAPAALAVRALPRLPAGNSLIGNRLRP